MGTFLHESQETHHGYTYKSKDPNKSRSHIDYILLSNNLISPSSSCKIIDSYEIDSDKNGIHLLTSPLPKPAPTWRFDSSLLKSLPFQSNLASDLNDFLHNELNIPMEDPMQDIKKLDMQCPSNTSFEFVYKIIDRVIKPLQKTFNIANRNREKQCITYLKKQKEKPQQ